MGYNRVQMTSCYDFVQPLQEKYLLFVYKTEDWEEIVVQVQDTQGIVGNYVACMVIKNQIGNQYRQAMEDASIGEAMREEIETWYRTKVRDYRNFKQFRKGFMKNHWGTKEESVMKSELQDNSKKKHIIKLIDKTKNFDDLVKTLKAHDKCEKDRKRVDEHFKPIQNGNKEDEEPKKDVDKEININNVDIRRDAENDNPNGGNGVFEKQHYLATKANVISLSNENGFDA
ncbi:hypothetical protein FQA39_LY08095 [Lamprigera yunnana]|nr:hypothetical protein FQA39_LY08095 [Lamprigera yunnana]